MFLNFFKKILPLVLLTVLSACQTTDPVQHGVVFSKLPRFLGGGVKDKIIAPGKTTWLWPWEDIYLLDTSIQSLTWDNSESENKNSLAIESGQIKTRTRDGNEVGLIMTVQYHIDPKMLHHLIQRVGTSNERIRDIVRVVARSDIRTHMNTLKTKDFISASTEESNQAIANTKKALEERLEPEGIVIDQVIYNDHKFERDLPDGTKDRTFQQQLEKAQATSQDAEREAKRIKAIEEQKKKEANDAEAAIFRKVEEAKGYQRQAHLRGDSFLKVKQNEAAQIEAVGNAEIEGLKKQISAFSGLGGKNLLKLSIVNVLSSNSPKFAIVGTQSPQLQDELSRQCVGRQDPSNILVNKLDTNDLVRYMGIFSAMSERNVDTDERKTSGIAK